jgi:hypothetical protein
MSKVFFAFLGIKKEFSIRPNVMAAYRLKAISFRLEAFPAKLPNTLY